MFRFSKKRFFITLVLSVIVWLTTGFAQALLNEGEYGAYLFGAACELTGYPAALCVPNGEKVKIFGIYLLNILFWFFVIHLFWGWFERRKSNG